MKVEMSKDCLLFIALFYVPTFIDLDLISNIVANVLAHVFGEGIL